MDEMRESSETISSRTEGLLPREHVMWEHKGHKDFSAHFLIFVIKAFTLSFFASSIHFQLAILFLHELTLFLENTCHTKASQLIGSS